MSRRTAAWIAWPLGITCAVLLALSLLATNLSYPGVRVPTLDVTAPVGSVR